MEKIKMKLLTVNQFKFGFYLLLLTIMLHAGITLSLNAESYTFLWAMVPIFVIPVVIIGWRFGRKDGESIPFANTGFKFHLITYVVSMIVPELKFLFGLASSSEDVSTTHMTAISWGLGVLLHYILYKFLQEKTIKGIGKSNIFE